MPRRPPEDRPKGRKPTREELQIWQAVTHQDKRMPKADIDWHQAEDTPAEKPNAPDAFHVSSDQIESLISQPVFTRAGEAHAPPRTEGGLDRNSARRLRQGKFAIEGTLDLHGLTREEAWNALVGFLQHGFELQKRCVLVITGKGRFRTEAGFSDGVLRMHLPRWLGQEPCNRWVLRHETAQPHHGGEGAFYILLRRKR